jgi:hypothetical protein
MDINTEICYRMSSNFVLLIIGRVQWAAGSTAVVADKRKCCDKYASLGCSAGPGGLADKIEIEWG